MKLPISAIIPIYNCQERLRRHLQTVVLWADCVKEIIVVDSGSSDGSLEVSKEVLSPFGSRFLHHPPGLYQSWNAGIAAASSDFCYISTVEDPITFEGLNHLHDVIVRHASDVVISPPEIRNHDGSEASTLRMPSNILADHFLSNVLSDRLLNRSEIIALLCGILPHGLLGSSASNLYRTSLLQQNTFPTDFGHCGDTAWGIKVSPWAQFAFTPKTCAKFYCQTDFKTETPDQQLTRHKQLANLVSESLNSESKNNPDVAVMLGWFESSDASMQIIRKWLADQFNYREQIELELNYLRAKYQGGIISYISRVAREELKRIF